MAKITKNKNKVTVKFSVPEEAAIIFGRDGVEVICPPFDECGEISENGDEDGIISTRQMEYLDSMKMTVATFEKVIGAIRGLSEVEIRQTSGLKCINAEGEHG